MTRRLLKWLVLPLLVVVILCLALKSWLLHSDPGARWMMAQVSSQMGDQLSLGEVSGNLDSGLLLTKLVYRQDGLSVDVARVEAQGEISLLPLKIIINSLNAFDVVVHTFPTEELSLETERSMEDILAGLKLPLELDMQNLKITRLKVIDENNEILLKLDKSALSARWKETFELRQLEMSSEHFQASLKGELQLESPFAHQIALSGVAYGLESDAGNATDAGHFEASLKGTAHASVIDVISHFPAFEISGQINRPFGEPELNLQVQLAEHCLCNGEQNTDVLISDVIGKVRGLPTSYSVQIQATVTAAEYLPAIIELAGYGDLSSFKIEQMSAKADFLEAEAAGHLSWGEQFSYDFDIQLQRLLPSIWMPEWPNEKFVSGRLSVVSEDSSIRIHQLQAKVAGTAVQIEGQGVYDPQQEILDATLGWASIGWPLWQQSFLIASEQGELHLSGAPDDWEFAGDINLQSPDYPGGSFQLRGQGDLHSANINIDSGQVLGGNVKGNASLDWNDALRWQADLDVRKLDTTAFLNDWPARLDAIVKVSQDAADQSFLLQFDQLHADLGGQFKGQSLDGKGGLTYGDSGIYFDAMQLYSDNSSMTLQGNPEASEGVKFALEVHGPDWISSYLGGEISAKGQIALAADQPMIDVTLAATEMQWGDWQAEQILIGPADASQTNGINLAMDVTNFILGETAVQSARFELTGDRSEQRLSLKINQENFQLDTSLIGALSSWTSLQGISWAGVLKDTQLSLNEEFILSQNTASPVAFSAQKVNLEKICLLTVGSGELCVASDWQLARDFDIEVNMSAIPLSITTLAFEHGIDFSQMLDGEFKWEHHRGKSPSGRMAVNISAGEFGDIQERFERVKTGKGFLGFELHEGNLTAGELDVPFPGVGQIDVNYAVTGLLLDGNGNVDGNAKIDFNDISILEGLIPGLENLAGQLTSDLKLSGITSDPNLDGSVNLLNASADIPFVGTQLREVSLRGEVSNADNAILQGGFKAGDGQGQLKLTSNFADWNSLKLQLNISGQRLRVLNTEELRMDADTDISLGWADQKWTVGGSILVQDARITPATVAVGTVNESEDVRIVQGELPYFGEVEEIQPVKLNGNLKITLGDKVRVETDLAKAKLSGAVNLKWNDNLIPMADGAIQTSGTVSIFGPRLTLTDGQIRFPNIPVDNPILDVRAERDIFGSTQIRTAGVSITGTAKRPVIDAYTVPLTNSDRAWALLITGNDVDYGQSVGAFEVGTYIAPKLYLSYGISLFNDGNVVSARYDLKKGFGIKGTSGQREAGVDVSYTIDR